MFLSFDLCTFPEILIPYILNEICVVLKYLEIYLDIEIIFYEKYEISWQFYGIGQKFKDI